MTSPKSINTIPTRTGLINKGFSSASILIKTVVRFYFIIVTPMRKFRSIDSPANKLIVLFNGSLRTLSLR